MKKLLIKHKIAELEINLHNTDYQAIKFAEGELTISEYAEIKEQRKKWRTEINALKTELKVLEGK